MVSKRHQEQRGHCECQATNTYFPGSFMGFLTPPPAHVQFSFGVDHDVGGARVVVSRSKGQIFKSSGFDSPGGALLLP